MQPLIWDRRPDGLRAPAMVCAFQGWNDAGDAASSAVSFLASLARRAPLRAHRLRGVLRLPGQPAERPARRATNEREIAWPTVEIFEARAPRAPRDLVLVQGVEPSMRWRAFSAHIVDLAEALGVQVVVSLGALLGDVPHTRPVAMTGHASDPALLERLGISASPTRAPPGSSACCTPPARTPACRPRACGPPCPTTSPPPTNPKAALALLRRVEVLIGVSVDVSELESAAGDYERQVGLAVQSDPDIQAFVERLEQAAESDEEASPEDVPSGDALAREFQRFLRQRGRESDEHQPAHAASSARAVPAPRSAQPSAAGQTIR